MHANGEQEYYQQQDARTWVPYGQPMLSGNPALATAPYTVQAGGRYGTRSFNATFTSLADHITETYLPLSPWHQVPLQPAAEGGQQTSLFNFIVEIPRGTVSDPARDGAVSGHRTEPSGVPD